MTRITKLSVRLAALALVLAPLGAAAEGGQAIAWGQFLHYLGDNRFSTNAMAAPAAATNVIALASGLQHSAALRADGSVVVFGEWAWGLANLPAGLTNAVLVSAGDYHTLALTRNREVKAWGAGFNNQLVVPPAATNLVTVAAGGFHSLALRADGQVLAWGDNRYGQCTVPPGLTNVVGLAAGAWHSLALLNNGRVVAWGSGSSGQLNVPPTLNNAVALAARASYSLALRSDGSIVAWGLNDGGQLNLPALAQAAQALAAGERHALALLRDGQISAWGGNTSGQATLPPQLGSATAVAAGSLHSAAVVGCVPPSAAPPQPGLTVRVDRRILLTAAVPGSQPMTYQWRRDGVPVTGATGALLALNRAQPADAGTYSVVASNAAGVVTNVVARLDVWVPELSGTRFLFRDDSTAGNWKGVYGTQASLILGHATNDASAVLSLTRGLAFPFATNSPDPRALERVDTPSPASRFFGCVFDADFIEVRCALPPRVTNEVALYLVEPGGGRTESVDVLDDLTGDLLDHRSLPTLTNGTYLVWEVTGPVRFRVTRLSGANALLSGVFLGRVVNQSPSLRVQPASATVPQGARALLAGAANGAPPLAFQWRKNGLPVSDSPAVSGARSPILAFAAVSAADVGNYTLAVSNLYGMAISAAATLSLPGIGVAPVITSQPASRTNAVGQDVSFSVTATGTAPLAYQWRFNGAQLLDATNDTYLIASVQRTNDGAYEVAVSNPFGAATSSVAYLAVKLRGRMIDESDPVGFNRPPVAADDFLVVAGAGAGTIPVSAILNNDHDPDGDALRLAAFGPLVTRQGGTVRLDGDHLVYLPPSGNHAWDAFGYVVEDREKAAATATVTLQLGGASNGSWITSLAVDRSAAWVLRCSGVPGRTYLLQAADTPEGPWQNVSTNRAGADGGFEWTDPAPLDQHGGARRFYRTAVP